MRSEEIQTFLAIVECGNISAAAEKLYINQSSVSHRLDLLEQELDVKLLIRSKGSREIALTQAGKKLVPLAQQWNYLINKTRQLKTQPDTDILRIGSVDAINNFTFVPFYQNFITSHEHLKLQINTFHSTEIHSLLENRTLDLGYVFSQIHYPNVQAKAIFHEKMYLICHRDSPYYDGISPAELKSEDEVYLRWGYDYELWHDYYWPEEMDYLITVNTGVMLAHYLYVPNRWAIAPISVIAPFNQRYSLAVYQLSDPPPNRICYELTHRQPLPTNSSKITYFQKLLTDFIRHNPNVYSDI